MARAVNPAGLALIERFEGLRLDAYRDVAGVWTIGYGHTPAAEGQRLTQAQAASLLLGDLAAAEGRVDALTRDVPTSDNQFAAMVSLAFNIGAAAFRASSVLRLHRAGDPQAAADAFLLWNKAHVDGALVTVAGLAARREAERALYLTPDTGAV